MRRYALPIVASLLLFVLVVLVLRGFSDSFVDGAGDVLATLTNENALPLPEDWGVDECRAQMKASPSEKTPNLVPSVIRDQWPMDSPLPWHTQLLCLLNEPPLVLPRGGDSRIRLTRLSRSETPYTIRIERGRTQTSADHAKFFKYAGRLHVSVSTRPLDEFQMEEILQEIEKVGFWALPSDVPKPPVAPRDELWLVEISRSDRYHAVVRPSGYELDSLAKLIVTNVVRR